MSRHLIIALSISGAFIIVLCLICDPRWDTNDDVAMSMVAHGYGIAQYGSPRLIFSNVLWGVFVRALPSIDGLLGYSTATLLSLTLASAATLYFLLRLGAGYVVAVLVLAVVFARPVLFPQFTINAGLLTVAAVLGLCAYIRGGSPICLIAACGLAFMAYLVRSAEFLLVAGAALPLLPCRQIVRSRVVWLAAAGFAICIASATVIDSWAYSAPEWQAFWSSNLARKPFTDFAAADRILLHPEVIQRLGVSKNDIRLVAHFFFADPRLTDPGLLNALLSEVPRQIATGANFGSGVAGVSALSDPSLLPLALTGIFILAFCFRRGRLVAWIMLLIAMFAIGAAGRPNTARVYIPLLSLLIVIPVAAAPRESRWRYGGVLCILLSGLAINSGRLWKEVGESEGRLRQARAGEFVTTESIAVWGASLPFEYVFPVFTRESDTRDNRIYGLGTLTLAPYSVATADERAGRGFLTRLRSEAGILLIVDERDRNLLNGYCTEHYGTPLRLSVTKQTQLWAVMNASCAAADTLPTRTQ